MISSLRLQTAYERVRTELLAAREPAGHWIGQLASSALSTATAVSALALMERGAATSAHGYLAAEASEVRPSNLLTGGLRWLAAHQNADGGWGDTDRSVSNIATSMLASAAFHLAGEPAAHAGVLERAEQYIQRQGGVPALRRRYGRDKTFAAPILTNCALAGRVSWSQVPSLPFELACLPAEWWKLVRLPVVSYAIPALVAIGQAKYHHRRPWEPLTRILRRLSVEPSLRVIQRQQPASGGYLEAVPLTSFVVMSLASIGRAGHPVAQRGEQFLFESVRPDGSWPIDTNLATWNTSLAVNALAAGGSDVAGLHCWDWLLACQHQQVHAFTGAAPGAWAWTDLSGGVPDADDTPGALLALAAWCRSNPQAEQRALGAAARGVGWLLDLQNRDGGWPTFCRGWGRLPFDRSGCDLTAHALRALHAWRVPIAALHADHAAARAFERRIAAATRRGLQFLERRQAADGSWEPLWFGNQYHPQESNPVYGTARVLLAYRDLELTASAPAGRGLAWLVAAQCADGGWGDAFRGDGHQAGPARASVEETAVAVECLAGYDAASAAPALERGVEWLVRAVETEWPLENSPIGFYFAKLWYYEKLYPLIFTVAALGQALRRREIPPESQPAVYVQPVSATQT